METNTYRPDPWKAVHIDTVADFLLERHEEGRPVHLGELHETLVKVPDRRVKQFVHLLDIQVQEPHLQLHSREKHEGVIWEYNPITKRYKTLGEQDRTAIDFAGQRPLNDDEIIPSNFWAETLWQCLPKTEKETVTGLMETAIPLDRIRILYPKPKVQRRSLLQWMSEKIAHMQKHPIQRIGGTFFLGLTGIFLTQGGFEMLQATLAGAGAVEGMASIGMLTGASITFGICGQLLLPKVNRAMVLRGMRRLLPGEETPIESS